MPVQPVERKLAAIFAADIVGYGRLMARDEIGTLARLRACRTIIDGLIAAHRGRIFNTAGSARRRTIAEVARMADRMVAAAAAGAPGCLCQAGEGASGSTRRCP